MVEVYKKLYSKEPELVAIHAGLECGILSEKIDGLDCISIGPDMQDIHSAKEKLSVRDTERLVKKLVSDVKRPVKKRDYEKEAILGNLSEQLKDIFGTKVSISENSRHRGKIEIEYYSDDELNRIFELLQSVK